MTRALRRTTQLAVLLAAAWAGLGLALGWSRGGVERFCPFGGVETLWSIVTRQAFTCAMGPYNLTLLLALVAVTLVARKAFCGWVCPVGTVAEALGALGRRLRRGGTSTRPGLVAPPRGLDAALRWLRLPVLGAVLGFTVGTGELIFRPYDPYYVLFSAHGHDVRWWSYPVVGALMGAAVVVPMAWCRYLCPLGGVLWPFSRVGLARVRRDARSCVACGRCDAACPHGLAVADRPAVTSGECTLCLECVEACGERRALALTAGRRRVPAWSVAVALGLAALVGLAAAEHVAFASVTRDYRDAAADADLRHVTFDVEGVRCVDTAELAATQLARTPGAVRFTAFAADHRVTIAYDARATDPARLQRALEGPVWNARAGEFRFGVFKVLETLPEEEP
jgi:ferredoxin